MPSLDLTTSFGATIVPTQKRSYDELTLPSRTFDTPSITPQISREDLTPVSTERRIPPHSPFYQHECDSFERGHSRSTSKVNVPIEEKDLEAGRVSLAPHDGLQPFTSKLSIECSKQDKMWPSKQELIQDQKSEKRKQRNQKLCGGCGPVVEFWERKTKKQKLCMKIAFALFVVGVIIAIALGISVAVNGTVYVSDGHMKQLPDPDND